jgi:hypothetical protein
MTPLRRQLHSAARAYRAVRYPGDLAAEVLPAAPSASSGATARRTSYGLFPLITAAAALVLIAIVLRPTGPSQNPSVTSTDGDNTRNATTLVSLRPTTVPVPTVHVPSFPRRVPDPLPQDIDVDGYRMRYDDLAGQVAPIAPRLRQLTVPKISDLPDKGFDWLQKVWTADESA